MAEGESSEIANTGLEILSREAEEMVRNLEYANSDISEEVSISGSPALEAAETDSTGSVSSGVDIVKEELRNRIKSRRVAQGLDENPDIASKRPKLEQLTEEEEEKRRVRRERNKLAAMKCRQRRKEHIQELTVETEGIESDNDALEREIACLREQKKQLETMLSNHACCLRIPTAEEKNNNEKVLPTSQASTLRKESPVLTLLIRSSSESSCSSEAAKSNGSITPDSPNKSIGAY